MPGGELCTVLRYLHKAAALRRSGGLSDGALLERFAARGEEAAFEALVQRHGPMVLGVCRRVLGDAHEAEDAFQATFLVLVRNARSVGKAGSVGSWLHGVAHRTALKARAAQAARRKHERRVAVMANNGAGADAAWGELRQVLDEEVGRLPEACRGPFVLCYLEGKTYDEAARLLGCPKGTVSTRLARARELLRARLTRRGLALSAGLLATALSQGAAPAVPPALTAATVSAAASLAAGAAVSPPVAALTEGVLKAMLVSKCKVVTAVLLAVGVVVGGAGGFAYRMQAAEQPAPGQRARPANPPAEALVVKAQEADLRKQQEEIARRIERLIAADQSRTVLEGALRRLEMARDDAEVEKALDEMEKVMSKEIRELRRQLRRRPPAPDDKVWQLNFRFKDLRFALHAGWMAKSICYLCYDVSNPTGQPHTFVPDFELVVPGKEDPYHDVILPEVQKEIQQIEDPANRSRLANSVTIAATPLLPVKEGGKPVAGVAIWDGLVTGDECTVYVSGLTNAWKVVEKDQVWRKALKLEFKRAGKEMRLAGPVEWVYRRPHRRPAGPARPARLEEIDRAVGDAQRILRDLEWNLKPLRDQAEKARSRLNELRRQREDLLAAPQRPKPAEAAPAAATTLQVRLAGPPGMKVARFVPAEGGKTKSVTSVAKEAPCRLNLPLGQTVRLKLSDIPNRPGLTLYPSVEVMPANSRTAAFVANTFANLTFTPEDFDQVAGGRLVIKVIYLKGAEGTEPDEVTSPRLEPGADPIAEAGRRGSLLMVVRLGGIDLEAGGGPEAPEAKALDAKALAALRNWQENWKIVRLDASGKVPYINLGSADRVTPGLTFSVHGVGRDGRPLPAVKGTVEVFKVLGEHLSQARVTSVAGPGRDPIIQGDLLFNPSWHPMGGIDLEAGSR
jgi:RNA polymerase sigma factor (sigma-70 family)